MSQVYGRLVSDMPKENAMPFVTPYGDMEIVPAQPSDESAQAHLVLNPVRFDVAMEQPQDY